MINFDHEKIKNRCLLMKIALYFGSFNPIHLGHIIIANYITEFFFKKIDSVWFIVSPQNPLKKKIINYQFRIKMVQIAILNFKKMKILDIESGFYPSYTIYTLNQIEKKFPKMEFYLLLGEDSFSSLKKWKSYQMILNQYNILVYPRLKSHLFNPIFQKKKIIFLDAPIIEISSSFIRNAIQNKKNVQPLLTEKVWDYIQKNKIYN